MTSMKELSEIDLTKARSISRKLILDLGKRISEVKGSCSVAEVLGTAVQILCDEGTELGIELTEERDDGR